MRSKVLAELKEEPSFEGALSIRLSEERDSEGRAKYYVECRKNPPLKETEFEIFFEIFLSAVNKTNGQNLNLFEDITKGIEWRREVSLRDAEKITAALESQVMSVVPEEVFGLDGTTYELVIKRGFNKIQFRWWGEPPAAWRALRELSNTLLGVADAASMIEEAQQSDKRKRIIQQLQEELDDRRAKLRDATIELVRAHNSRCLDLQALSEGGLMCPNCRVRSSQIRFVDKSPLGKSYFICNGCGRSFRPEDL